jgi:arylsulfatase B
VIPRISFTPFHPAFLLFPLVLAACDEAPTEASPVVSEPAIAEPAVMTQPESLRPPNFIIMLGDDMGVETLSLYGIGDTPASTPNLDQLAANGMVFEQFWTQPICSPTRAAILTGQYGFRNGVLNPIYPRTDLVGVDIPNLPADALKELDANPVTGPMETPQDPLSMPPFILPGSPSGGGLSPDAVTLANVLKGLPVGYTTAAVGKWHLADSENGWLDHPQNAGFDYYSGPLLGVSWSHQRWPHVENGVAEGITGYVENRITEDGIAWLQAREENDQPWLLWVGYVNPHEPIHLPPRELLHSKEALALTEDGLTPDNIRPYAMAQIEAMDTLIGQLLAAIPASDRDNTWIIFMGDNGSEQWANPAPPVDPARSKTSVYEGGVRVPMIVSGPGIIAGSRTTNLGNSVDIFATLVELAGGDSDSAAGSTIDGVSLVDTLTGGNGSREWIFADSGWRETYAAAIRNDLYKLVTVGEAEELFDMQNDPWESTNLLAGELDESAASAYETLQEVLSELLPDELPDLRMFPDGPAGGMSPGRGGM